jgi:hypothetical protein
MIPGFGDIVEFDGLETGYVIGYPVGTTDEVMVAKPAWIGIPVKIATCRVVAAGFHDMARRLQERYRLLYPTRLQGLFVEDDGKRHVY